LPVQRHHGGTMKQLLLNKASPVQECDATMLHRNPQAGNKKKQQV